MPTHFLIALSLGLLCGLAVAQRDAQENKGPKVKAITPVLFVEQVEPCMQFWTERLGFEKTSEVPDGNRLGFVILRKGNIQIMYQTFASQEKDSATLAKAFRKGPTFLYIEVEKLEPLIAAMRDANVVLPVRATFYGAREIGVTDPAGHFILFAEFSATPQH